MDENSAPFRHAFPLDYAALRERLRSHGYSQEAIVALLAGQDAERDGPVLLRRTEGDRPLALLARLFFLHQPISVAAAEALFAPVDVCSLVTCGLLLPDGAGVRAAAKLIPSGDFFILSDFSAVEPATPLSGDHVLGVGAATMTLSALTPGRIFRSALDVGTGCGIQALRASRHCSHVVATDINPRALNFAAMNARLNGADNIEFRHGSFFEPANGERFDLLVSNPPFVISPERRFVFRDAAGDGDFVSEHFVRETPRYLNDDGLAVVLINWHHASEEDWTARPASWSNGSDCDRWLLRFRSADPLTYAADWLRPTEHSDAARYGATLDAWLAYYRRLEIGRISAGAIVLRRRAAGAHWQRTDTVAYGNHAGNCGAHLERIIAAETALADLADERELLEWRLRLHADYVLNTRLRAAGEAWEWSALELSPNPGLSFTGNVDATILAILGKCDGEEPLRAILERTARELGHDLDEITAPSLRVIGKLLRAGFLVITPRADHPAGRTQN